MAGNAPHIRRRSPERPDSLVPVITAGEFAHRGSFRSLTGTDDIAAHQPHSLENLVTPDTPPTFLWHTWTDGAVPVENTLLMAMALHKAGVPAEVHVFPRGGHGVALGNQVTNIPSEEARKIVPEATVWTGISGAVHPADIYEIIIKNPCF